MALLCLKHTISADQLTLSQAERGGAHYAHHITTYLPTGFSNLATAMDPDYMNHILRLFKWLSGLIVFIEGKIKQI